MESAHIINTIIHSKGYRSYLEIGVRKFRTFNQVQCDNKIAVDPNVSQTDNARLNVFQQTSDNFFAWYKKQGWLLDIIFIDGLHHADQVIRDVYNSLAVLSPGGTIILDDVNPATEEMQKIPYKGQYQWTGDVWKAWVKLRANENINQICISENFGYGIITRGKQRPKHWDNPTYGMLKQNRQEMLNLMSWQQYKETL